MLSTPTTFVSNFSQLNSVVARILVMLMICTTMLRRQFKPCKGTAAACIFVLRLHHARRFRWPEKAKEPTLEQGVCLACAKRFLTMFKSLGGDIHLWLWKTPTLPMRTRQSSRTQTHRGRAQLCARGRTSHPSEDRKCTCHQSLTVLHTCLVREKLTVSFSSFFVLFFLLFFFFLRQTLRMAQLSSGEQSRFGRQPTRSPSFLHVRKDAP